MNMHEPESKRLARLGTIAAVGLASVCLAVPIAAHILVGDADFVHSASRPSDVARSAQIQSMPNRNKRNLNSGRPLGIVSPAGFGTGPVAQTVSGETVPNIPTAPYYVTDSGVKSTLAKHIRIMTNNGTGPNSREAGVIGDWKNGDGNHPLQVVQEADVTKAWLKVCVVDQTTGDCAADTSSEGYGVASSVAVEQNGSVKLNGVDLMSASFAPVSTNEDSQYIYVRLGNDFNNPNVNEGGFSAGEVVKIPILRAGAAPSVASVGVYAPSDINTRLDFANAGLVRIEDKKLKTDGDGIIVEIEMKGQPGKTYAPCYPDSRSCKNGFMVTYGTKALDVVSLNSLTNGSCSTGMDEGSCSYRFQIDWKLLEKLDALQVKGKNSVYVDLNQFKINTYGANGRESSIGLAGLKPFIDDENNQIVSGVQLFKFPAASDMNNASGSFVFSTKVVNDKNSTAGCKGVPSSLCATEAMNPTLISPGKDSNTSASAVLDPKSISWLNSLSDFKPIITYTIKDQNGVEVSNFDSCKQPQADCSVSKLNQNFALLKEGTFSITFRIVYTSLPRMITSKDLQTATIYVTVDGTRPTISVTDSPLSGEEKTERIFAIDEGSSAFKGILMDPSSPLTYTVRVCDLLKTTEGAVGRPCMVGDTRSMNEAGTSGIDMRSVQFLYTRYDDFDSMKKAMDDSSDNSSNNRRTRVPLNLDASGVAKVTFKNDGAYPLKDMEVQAKDMAGNEIRAKLVAASPADVMVKDGAKERDGADSSSRQPNFDAGYDVIVFAGKDDNPDTKPKVELELNDASDSPKSKDALGKGGQPYYHRGTVSATVSVRDKWFGFAKQLDKNKGKNLLTCKVPSSEGCQPVGVADLRFDAKSNTWRLNVDLPLDSATGKSVQGQYELKATYYPSNSPRIPLEETKEFGIDYTGPVFNNDLHYSQLSPRHWNWIFSPGTEDITVSARDEVSGVDDASVRFDGRWQGRDGNLPLCSADAGIVDCFGSVSGKMNIRFGTDGSRLIVKDSKLYVEDIAGNASSIDDLSARDSNLPKDTVGIAVDTKTPTIAVSFDNNNVRNEKYYKANRTGTVVIDDSSFDFVKTNDKRREIVVKQADGSKMSVTAEKFENPSGDKHTWVAQAVCDHDADWVFDVSFMDPADHVAAPYHTQFTVDTQKPILEMEFDNNDVSGGNYYKAARTASIRQIERNFSPADTSVIVVAKDAGGASAAAPAAAPWSVSDKQYTRSTSVLFNRELHYTLNVQATDLAGNMAEALVEPEFVIDMTAPRLNISKVSDKTAYAGKVTPQIDFSDTNFDPLFAQYKLTRIREPDESKKGQSAKPGKTDANEVYLQAVDQKSDTAETVLLPDIEHTVDNDDIYTLEAEIRDKAGNEAKQKVVFSLNRFGSNYIFDGATRNILGQYVKAPRPIHVTEINVSGLDLDKSHTELVHNQDVSQIWRDKDYRMVSDATSGWQENTYDFPAELFAADGYYRLRLTSVDVAGNLSQNTMNKKNEARNADAQVNFAVDQQLPSAGVAQLKSGAVFYASSHDFVVSAKDDVMLKSAELKVDGHTVGRWNGKETQKPMSYSMDSDQRQHEVEVVSTDMAGNQVKTSYSGVVVASSWWAYMIARGYLLPSIFMLIVMLAFIGMSIVMIVRHRRAIAYRRNMFNR